MKYTLIIRSSSCNPGHLSQRNENLGPHRSLYMIVLAVLFVIAQNWEKIKISYNREMVKKTMVQPYHGMLLGSKRE